MTHTPQISALMSAYNSSGFISEAIDSVLAQTFEDFELIIVSDGSTDDTEDIILSYNDKRIRYVPLNQNVGVGKALSIGLEHVTAPFIAKVDSDDINHPQRFQKQLKFLNENPDITLCKTLIDYFPDNKDVATSERYTYMKETKEKLLNSIVSKQDLRKHIADWLCIAHNSYMARTEAVNQVGYKDTRMAEDFWLFYKLSEFGYEFGTVEERLVNFRVRNTSLTGLGSNTDYYVDTVMQMKFDNIKVFINTDKPIYIWGIGGLATSVKRSLSRVVNIEGFINYDATLKKKENLKVHNEKDLLKNIDIKIILAAQPIREKAINDMENAGFKHNEDFFVFA